MILLRIIMAALAGAAFFVSAALADPPVLQFPLECDLGQTCFIQQYMDRNPGPDAQDYRCGPLSYDAHTGTDFRLPDHAAMADGVAVLAAAAGTVTGRRNSAADAGRADVTDGQECGNGIVIDHGDGWQTQYCHMRQGSVSVHLGQQVQAGATLGLVGYSGNTEFPHLHLSVRQDGTHIDPFDMSDTCGGDGASLWQTPLAYQPGGILTLGFSDVIPKFSAIQAGLAGIGQLTTNSPAVVIWGYMFGARAGDEVQLSIRRPDGTVLHDVTVMLERRQAQLFRASGLRMQPESWSVGDYTGEIRLLRHGVEIDQRQANISVTAP